MKKLFTIFVIMLAVQLLQAHNSADWHYVLSEASSERSLLVMEGKSHQLIRLLSQSCPAIQGLDVEGGEFESISTEWLEQNLRFTLGGRTLKWRFLEQDVGPHRFTLRYVLDLSHSDLHALNIDLPSEMYALGHSHHHLRLLFHNINHSMELRRGINTLDAVYNEKEANFLSLQGKSNSPLFVVYCLILIIFGLIGLMLHRLLHLAL